MATVHDFFGAVFSACSVQNKLKCKNNSVMDYLFMFDALILLESFAQISGRYSLTFCNHADSSQRSSRLPFFSYSISVAGKTDHSSDP